MSVITTEHLDDHELTEDERLYWRAYLRESLADDYEARVRALHASGDFPLGEEGWQALRDQAWAEAIANNEVCKKISAISAERRLARGDDPSPPRVEVDEQGAAINH